MLNTPLSRDADAEWAARSRGNLTSSGAGGNTPTRNVLYPFCRARTSTREMEGKVGSGTHYPGLPTVDYSTTSPGGFPLRIKSITGSLAFVGESWDRCAVLWLARWHERARARVVRVGCLAGTGVVGVCWRRRAQVPGLHRAGTCGLRGRGSHVDRLRSCG